MNLYKIIKEEINDFEWIENISSKFIPKVGDVIEITNVGSYDTYLKWLGVYKEEYLNGNYGTKITGRIIDVEDTIDMFYIVETNTQNKIFLPYGGSKWFVHHSYPGLKLLYQSV